MKPERECAACGKMFRLGRWSGKQTCSIECSYRIRWRGRRADDPMIIAKGRATRAKSLPDRFWARVDRSAGPDACWPWRGRVNKTTGYGVLMSEGAPLGAHRTAYVLAVSEIPAGMQICHRCDNPPCCNPGHLFLGTHRENHADKVAKGRHTHGLRHHKTKLTVEEVREVLDLKNSGSRTRVIAARFRISSPLVNAIARGKHWTFREGYLR